MTLEVKKHAHRSELASIKEMLSCIAEFNAESYNKMMRRSTKSLDGIPITHISRIVELSTSMTLKKLSICIECGLVEEQRNGYNHSYTITQKGATFLQELKSIELELERVKLRL